MTPFSPRLLDHLPAHPHLAVDLQIVGVVLLIALLLEYELLRVALGGRAPAALRVLRAAAAPLLVALLVALVARTLLLRG